MHERPIQIEKTPEHRAFDTACSFHEAGIRCATSILHVTGVSVAPITPAITCYAFAAELYLKCLILNSQNIKNHRLNVLFSKLNESTKKKIKEKYASLTNRLDSQFELDLNELSNAFIDWRYVYEQDVKTSIDFVKLISFVQSLHFSIRETKPNWDLSLPMAERLSEINMNYKTDKIINYGNGYFRRERL